MFSPRAWGWSVATRRSDWPVYVLPTRVGMVRVRLAQLIGGNRSPHARGDGPSESNSSANKMKFSPRAWGWSVMDRNTCDACHVLPTRVGMVRPDSPSRETSLCSPHARGDGPYWASSSSSPGAFSPRAWGWSVDGLAELEEGVVLPTRVGMVRIAQRFPQTSRRSPHARGDGPCSVRRLPNRSKFSPRAWGWSGGSDCGAQGTLVLPTRVGMVRPNWSGSSAPSSSPHARGDGSGGALPWPLPILFSPRAWGWSVLKSAAPQGIEVLPTRVGMVRCDSTFCGSMLVLPTRVGMVRSRRRCNSRRGCSPHARGDGPSIACAGGAGREFSPRAWGWSALIIMFTLARAVLPTRVGMVRYC